MEKSAEDEVGDASLPGGSIAFRRAPRTGPIASSWPLGPDDRLTVRIEPSQPTLPWDDHRPDTGTIEAGTLQAGRLQAGIRVSRFGSSWAGPPSRGLPDPAAWSIRLVKALLEAVGGIRPVNQLDRWLAPPAIAQLTRRVRRRTTGERPTLQAIHLHRNAPTSTEVVAIFGWPDHTAAMAFRLDGVGGRWLCTALELAPIRRGKKPAAKVSRQGRSRSSPA